MDAAAGRRLEDKLDRVLDAVEKLSGRVGGLERSIERRGSGRSVAPVSPDSAAVWARVHQIAVEVEADPEYQRRHAEYRERYKDDPDGPIREMIERYDRSR